MDYVLLEGRSDQTAKQAQFTVIMLIFIDILSARGEPDLCLSQEPDGHERDRETLREGARGRRERESQGQGAEMGVERETRN